VDPAQARQLAERYFGPLPPRPLPAPIHTVDSPQSGPKTVAVESPSQPVLMVGYQRPAQTDKDDPVFDLLSFILSSGRTGVMYKDLIEGKRLSLAAQTVSTYPGGRYPNLFVFFLVPALGHTAEDNLKAMDELLAKFESVPVDAATLERVKTKARAGLIRRLDSNSELASMLTSYYAAYGDWRKLFTSLDEYNKVTAGDVQRVARTYFSENNRTIASIQQPARQTKGATAGGGSQ
jgi:predicted Zn-dependent peptidase